MSLNSTYIGKGKLSFTLEMIDVIYCHIVNKIEEKYKFVKIDLPAFNYEGSEIFLPLDNKTRRISFDFTQDYKIVSEYLSMSNFIKKICNEIKKPLKAEGKTVWRDIVQDENNSVVNDFLIFTIPLKEDESGKKMLKQITDEVVLILYETAEAIEDSFGIKNIYNNNPQFIEAQLLENEMPELDALSREREILEEETLFVLSKEGARLFSGKIHRPIPPQVYDLINYNSIIMKDRINGNPIVVASVAIYAQGITLSDQLKSFGIGEQLNNTFYKKMASSSSSSFIEIKFNKSQIYQLLLAKGHLAEVQPNYISSDVEDYIDKKKIVPYR